MDVSKLLVIDLFSGEYTKNYIGHEVLNFSKNQLDDHYYGYCPPWDGIVISKLGAKKSDEYIDGITVVYVKKKDGSNDREIIGFCLNATVFRNPQKGEELKRFIEKNDDVRSATFSIKSDNLCDLRNSLNKFVIVIRDYNPYMFRMQRFYGGTYPELEMRILSYLDGYLEPNPLLDNDDADEQEEIQLAEPASKNEIKDSANRALCIVSGKNGMTIAKNTRLSKSSLIRANYTCSVNPNHKTFITKNGTFYMEGHHLIPCTVTNSNYFWDKFNRNIDCIENIVCLCPNCHREVHYAEWEGKSIALKVIYKQYKDNLEEAGIRISEEELLNLYRRY